MCAQMDLEREGIIEWELIDMHTHLCIIRAVHASYSLSVRTLMIHVMIDDEAVQMLLDGN